MSETQSETQIEVGDRVRFVRIVNDYARDVCGSEDEEVVGVVVDTYEETKHIGHNETMTQQKVVIDGDDGTTKDVPAGHLNHEIDADAGGCTIQIVEKGAGVEADDADEHEEEDDDDGAERAAADGEGDTDGEDQQLVTDGGSATTDYVDDATIEEAIAQHDDPDHPEALTVADVRRLLAYLQRETVEAWGHWLDSIERDDTRVVGQAGDVIALDTGKADSVRETLERYDGPVAVNEIVERVVATVQFAAADAISDHNWGAAYPRVVRLPADGEAGQRFVDAVINGLIARGCSPGQAWAYYGVEVRGESRNQWASRCGYSDHSSVSRAVRKAKETL